MRKFAKIMAALLLLALAAPCFAKGKVVTKWSATDEGETGYLTFYDDGTMEVTAPGNDVVVLAYTGDTKKNGTITLSSGSTCEVRGDRLFAGNIVFTKTKK